jgi:methyltransferase
MAITDVQMILGAVLLQRLTELWIARRNTERLLREGAVEIGAEHYPYFVVLHGAWLAALVLLTPDHTQADWGWLAVYGLLQAARLWVMLSLGRFWTTRILTVPGAPLVQRGPYRYVRHPNYLVVAGEIAVLPLAFGHWQMAVLFTLLNALLLSVRIRQENEALAQRQALD